MNENSNKIVFTNGCFDILHIGHMKLLEYCASLGKVIVGINSDASVKRLKGNDRPINNEFVRKKMLEGIRYVDEVIIFFQDDPYELIQQIMPDIIVKGGDYCPEQVVGNDLAEVIIFPFVLGQSSTVQINHPKFNDLLNNKQNNGL